jgi:GntR family transcriptional regulator/MocR family aminotransferase
MATYLQRYLGDEVTFQRPEGGLAFWVTFKKLTDVRELAEALLKRGVKISSCGAYSFHGEPMNAVRLGYATLSIEEMEEAIKIMGSVLATLHEPVLQAAAEPAC